MESWFKDDDLKIHSIEKGVLVADTKVNETFYLASGNNKSGVWHMPKGGKQGGIPLWKGKGQYQTKDPGASFPVSSPEGLWSIHHCRYVV